MKKALISLVLLFPISAFALSVSPSSPTDGVQATYTVSVSGADVVIWDNNALSYPIDEQFCTGTTCLFTLPTGDYSAIQMLAPYQLSDTGSTDFATINGSGYKVAVLYFSVIDAVTASSTFVNYATSTVLTNDGATLSFLLSIIIFILFLMVVAMVYNNFKAKQSWH